IQSNCRKIRINPDLSSFSGSLSVTFAAEMNHRLFVPVCFINIVAVFLGLSVNSHQTLVVTSCHAAFVSCSTAEIEHVPDMAGPEPWTLVQNFCHMLMVQCLIFFTVILACRIWSVVSDNAFTAVFRNTYTDVRVNLMEVIKPWAVVFHLSAVPAKVVIVALYIGDAMHWAFYRSHG